MTNRVFAVQMLIVEVAGEYRRAKRRRAGEPVMRLVRYADDFVIMVGGSRPDAEALKSEVSAVLAPMGLRLSYDKTRVCHIDEGFNFLGWRIQRRTWRNRPNKKAVYTYPLKKSLASVVSKVRRLTKTSETSNTLRPEFGGCFVFCLVREGLVVVCFHYMGGVGGWWWG